MHEIIGDVDVLQHNVERFGPERVGLHEFDALPFATLQDLNIASGCSNFMTLRNQVRHQVATDVTAGAEYEPVTQLHHSNRRPDSRRAVSQSQRSIVNASSRGEYQ